MFKFLSTVFLVRYSPFSITVWKWNASIKSHDKENLTSNFDHFVNLLTSQNSLENSRKIESSWESWLFSPYSSFKLYIYIYIKYIFNIYMIYIIYIIYIYIYVYLKWKVEKNIKKIGKNYMFEKCFWLMSLSIHSFFYTGNKITCTINWSDTYT